MLRKAAQLLHGQIAKAPAPIAWAYLNGLSLLCRHALPESATARIANSVASAGAWPAMAFRPRRVTVGAGTPIWLTPHLGEFDAAALFTRRLTYEAPVFAWLEREAAARYDLVIEIGANVGVYSVFLDALSRRSGARLKRIVAFEPSAEAFRRLGRNLEHNGATHVAAFNAAVAETSGLCAFFEPDGHLTNGSLIREFSGLFSERVAESAVLALGAAELERFLGGAAHALIKIDVEGFEPDLIQAMAPLIAAYHPDLLIEVLDDSAAAIERCQGLSGYARALVTEDGLQASEALYASPTHRDWLLTWPGDRPPQSTR